MSTLRRRPLVEMPVAGAILARGVRVAWAVAPGALRGRDASIPRGVRHARVEWTLGLDRGECDLVAGPLRRGLCVGHAHWSRDDDTGLWNLSVHDPSGEELLVATFRVGEAARVVYARTKVLAMLDLPGGRYDAPEADACSD